MNAKKIRAVYFHLSVTLILYGFISLNISNLQTPFGSEEGRYVDSVDSYSEGIVRNKVIDDFENSGKSSDGFLVTHPDFDKKDYSYKKEGNLTYLSQFGLQGRVDSMIAKSFQVDTPAESEHLFKVLRELNAFLLSATLALFVTAVAKEFGFWQALLVGLSFCVTNGIILFAKNLYWVAFTDFLPFCVFWLFYPKMRNRHLLVSVTAVGLMLFKSLNGYEFLTSITLSMLVPIIYYEFKDGKGFRFILLKSAYFLCLCVVGFLFALATHLVAASWHIGSFGEAVKIVWARIVERNLTYIPLPVMRYLKQNVYTLPLVNRGLGFYWIVLLMVVFYPIYKHVNRYKFTGIDLLLVCSLVSTMSWFVFGFQHIAWHYWVFYLTVNLCFLPIVTLFFADLIVSKVKIPAPIVV
ncbi:MAG: hypothetical protein ABI600_06395 [Luteolibacter sp.]